MRLLPRMRHRREQVRFIRETLAAKRTFDNRRLIASLSTVPDRINNLSPTIRSLLRQTRPPDGIVLAIPEFSIREQRPYPVPKDVSRCVACFGSAGLYRFTMFLKDVNTTTTRPSHFSRPGMSSLQIKYVYPCDGCGGATTEHRRLPGKSQR
jgi:hypothetical protein